MQKQTDKPGRKLLEAGLHLLRQTEARFPEERKFIVAHALTVSTPYGLTYEDISATSLPQHLYDTKGLELGPDKFLFIATTRSEGKDLVTRAILPRAAFTDVRKSVHDDRLCLPSHTHL